MKKYDIEYKKYGTSKAECYIGCFERMLTILFRNVDDENIEEVEDIMEENYQRWNEDYDGMCCEEYILEKLPKKYKNKIVAVIYESEEEENEI